MNQLSFFIQGCGNNPTEHVYNFWFRTMTCYFECFYCCRFSMFLHISVVTFFIDWNWNCVPNFQGTTYNSTDLGSKTADLIFFTVTKLFGTGLTSWDQVAQLFQDVFIVKPLHSRVVNSEYPPWCAGLQPWNSGKFKNHPYFGLYHPCFYHILWLEMIYNILRPYFPLQCFHTMFSDTPIL